MVAPKQLFLGIAAGVGLGLAGRLFAGDSAWFAFAVQNVAHPTGQIFLRLLFLLAVPLIFAALVTGVCELDLRHLGRLGLRTLGYTVVVSAIAVGIGLALVTIVRPGEVGGDLAGLANGLAETTKVPPPPSESGVELLIQLVPNNPVKAAATGDLVGILFFALLFGIGLALTPGESAKRLREVIDGLYQVTMRLVAGVLKLAPIGVGALLFTTTARLGVDVLPKVGAYVAVVVVGLALHLCVTYPLILRFLAGRSPLAFFRDVRPAMLTAFATASSAATLPAALEVADARLRLPRHVSRFVLTAGASMNQNGTALFEGVTVLFLAQAYGVELTLGHQALLLVICVLAGIGTAGVPAGSLPVIAMILATVGVPAEGLALIVGVDRLLDMCRTTLNVTGDLVAAAYVAHAEGMTSEALPGDKST